MRILLPSVGISRAAFLLNGTLLFTLALLFFLFSFGLIAYVQEIFRRALFPLFFSLL